MLAATPLWAADIVGSIIIHVKAATDEKPIAGATVRLQQKTGNQAPQEKQTGADGTVQFDNLLIGDYNVTVTQSQYETDQALLRVTVGSPLIYESLLDLKGQEKTIKVTENRLLVNTNSATNQGTQRDQTFRDQRLGDQSLQGIINTTPGVQGDAVGQFHPRGEHKGVSLSVDGVNLPIPNEATVNQIIDPNFLTTIQVQTGMYDASLGGNLGAILNLATDTGAIKPYVELSQTVGNVGTFSTLARAGGSANDGKFNWFAGGRWGVTDLRVEAPTPDHQTLGNHGRDESFLTHLSYKGDKDALGLTLSYSDTQYGVPQTPQNWAAGVRQQQDDSNLFGLISWRHKFSEHDDTLLALSYLEGRQTINNNGVFTPFFTFPAAISADLNGSNAPLDPQNPGSPYLPTASLNITQVEPTFEYNHGFSDTNKLKFGLSADFIKSHQNDFITDPGGGGGLPNPLGLATTPTVFAANVQRSGYFNSAYVSETMKPLDFLTINFGLRGDSFYDGALVRESQLTPRINTAFAITDTQVVRASFDTIFEPPPIEIDTSGLTFALPQKVNQYEVSYEAQPARDVVVKTALVYKDFHNQIDSGLLIPNSNIPIYAPVNFDRAYYEGWETGITTYYPTGFNAFLTSTIGVAKPTAGGPFEGAVPPPFNDHDQRVQLTGGVSYTWKKGPTAAFDFLYGSGYPLDAVASYNAVGINPYGLVGERIPHFIANAQIGYYPRDEEGHARRGWGWSLRVENLFNSNAVLGFLSSFSGTRFVKGRRVLAQGSFRW